MSAKLGDAVRLCRGWLSISLAMGLLLGLVSVAVAQSDQDLPPLTLQKTIETRHAVAGDRLTYLLTLTNTGPESLADVTVIDETPAQTTLFGVSGPPGWMMTSPGAGRSGQVVWQAQAPLPPDQKVVLELIVTVDALADGSLINKAYTAQAEGWAGTVTGPPVIIDLILPTPTWTRQVTPTPAPTETPTEEPVATATDLPTQTLTPAATATMPPEATSELNQNISPTPALSVEETSTSAGPGILFFMGVGVVIVALALIYFIRQKA